MKKINGKKLALHRETLASLSPDVLGDVVGGNAITGPLTRLVCPPSRLICPPKTLLGCTTPQAGGGGNAAGGNGGAQGGA